MGKKHHLRIRNAAITTIAPTGTISLIASCNGGIEPIFSIVFERKALDSEKFIQINELVEKLGTEQGRLSDKVRELLCKVLHQEIFQKYLKNSLMY